VFSEESDIEEILLFFLAMKLSSEKQKAKNSGVWGDAPFKN